MPPGVRVVPVYNRTPLIRGTVGTVTRTLLEAIITASVCIVLVLRQSRTTVDEGRVIDMPISVPRMSSSQADDGLRARYMTLCRFPKSRWSSGRPARVLAAPLPTTRRCEGACPARRRASGLAHCPPGDGPDRGGRRRARPRRTSQTRRSRRRRTGHEPYRPRTRDWLVMLSAAAWIGFIACFGMATSTGIMLVHLRQAVAATGGVEKLTPAELRTVVLDGAAHRLRPKLLTESGTARPTKPVQSTTSRRNHRANP